MTLFTRIPKHAHWQFLAFDSKEPGPQGMAYMGAVQVDVVANSYDAALRQVQEYRPLTGDRAGYELRFVTEHLEGHCKN